MRAGAAEADDEFLSPSATFQSLGLHADVIAALEAAGLRRPSQAMLMPLYRCRGKPVLKDLLRKFSAHLAAGAAARGG